MANTKSAKAKIREIKNKTSFNKAVRNRAVKSFTKGESGFMVAYKGREIVKQPLKFVANKIKKVDPLLLQTAKNLETIAF